MAANSKRLALAALRYSTCIVLFYPGKLQRESFPSKSIHPVCHGHIVYFIRPLGRAKKRWADYTGSCPVSVKRMKGLFPTPGMCFPLPFPLLCPITTTCQ